MIGLIVGRVDSRDSITRNMDRKRSRLDEHVGQLQSLQSQVHIGS